MKKMNKKGFTIVELVIVIAVIAILAAVMIPTFGGIIKKANTSSVQQTAQSLYKQVVALDLADGVQDGFEGDATVAANKIESKKVEGKTVNYDVTANNDGTTTIAFSYVDTTKKLTAEFNGNEWSVRDASAEELTTPQAPAEENTPEEGGEGEGQ